ncbi:MAG: YeeE/YedE family protein [Hyphomicrobiaceae bacterium]|nr:YeeE/YedE family protein [Hyphomicrobiaceae bacterium]
MTISALLDRWGDGAVLALAGAGVGLAFGAFAQHSKFCLRASVIEFAYGTLGPRLAIWVLAFSAGLVATQSAILMHILDVSEVRQLATRGSMSGAIIGGLMFGAGMVLSRGCASRLLVLSATGNLRSLVSGLILTIVAQASLRGILSPVREALAALWTIEGGDARNVLALLHAGPRFGLVFGVVCLGIGIAIARHNANKTMEVLAAIGVGLAVAVGWILTYQLSTVSFEASKITSITLTGPSADTLMGLINSRSVPLGFDVGLVPGIFLGSMIAALLTRQFKLQGFEGGPSMLRYITGACLMGFGGMLAGGCSVGAGISGTSIFALTAWTALTAMWIGAAAMDYAWDGRDTSASLPAKAKPPGI